MSARTKRIVMDSFSDDDDDSIPSPSPFSPAYIRMKPRDEDAPPAAKKLKVPEEMPQKPAAAAFSESKANEVSLPSEKPPVKQVVQSKQPPSNDANYSDSDDSDASESIQSEIISSHVQLEELPKSVPQLTKLNPSELSELELALQFDPSDPEDGWRDDWSANVALLSREVTNPLSKAPPGKNEPTQMLCDWALSCTQSLRLIRNLLRYVYTCTTTPPTAKRIIAHAHAESKRDPSYDLLTAIKRLSYDPAVLREDGWITAKGDEPMGATGGPYNIGTSVFWNGWEGVVIAYVHDSDIGDLWKAMWLDGGETFDLEAEELQEAQRKWEKRTKKHNKSQSSARFAAAASFSVKGVQHGIVMAMTYNPQARKGLFWPARVMHVSELTQSQGRRSSSKQKLQLVFLAPYWNGTGANSGNLALADSLPKAASAFSSGSLFEVDTVDASEETVQSYPYSGEKGLNLDELHVAFRFTGLPKNAFPRFLDSHRLALALKTYAQQELKSDSTHSHVASAALTDTHAMSIETAKFPTALLHLPFDYILSHLPHTNAKSSMGQSGENIEPAVQLRHIMRSMEPPGCWGKDIKSHAHENSLSTPPNGQPISPALSGALASPSARRNLSEDTGSTEKMTNTPVAKLNDVASNYLVNALSKLSSTASMASKLLDQLAYLLSRLRQDVAAAKNLSISHRRKKLLLFLKICLRTKVSNAS